MSRLLRDSARALEVEDPSIEALSSVDRRRIADVWAGRAASELHAAAGFAAVARALLSQDVAPEVQWLAARAVSDEVRHAEICRVVASRYSATEAPWPSPQTHPPTPGPAVPPSLGPTLAVVTLSCVQETLGGVFLELCASAARGALVRVALRELAADEIDHGRIGWAHLASIGADRRAALAPLLPEVLARCLDVWRARIAATSGFGAPAHGVPDPGTVAPALFVGLRDVVVPGFEHVGLDATGARAWLTSIS